MAKTLEQIMEEQMMKMMSQMTSQQVNSSFNSVSEKENWDDSDNQDEDDDLYDDFDEDDSDEDNINSDFKQSDDVDWSWAESGTDSNDSWSKFSSKNDSDEFKSEEAKTWGTETRISSDTEVTNGRNRSSNSSSFDNNNFESSEFEEKPMSSFTDSNDSNEEPDNIIFFQSGLSKTTVFALNNYSSIGDYTIDKDLFYSITEKNSFANDFNVEYGSDVNDSELMPLLIKFANNIIKDRVGETSQPTVNISTSSVAYEDLVNQVKNLTQIIEKMSGKIKKEKEFFNSQMSPSEKEAIFNNVFENPQPFEKLSLERNTANFFSNSFEYQCFNSKKDLNIDFAEGDDLTTVSDNMNKLSKKLLEDIYTMVGGAGRVTDLMVLSGLIIVNGVSYEPILPESYIKHIPVADRNAVMSGYYADFINYHCLKEMKNLVNLSFDSKDFVYGTVRKHLGFNSEFSPKDLFSVCKNLVNLQIGETQITRANKDEFKEFFNSQRRSSQIADWCTSKLDLGFSTGVSSIKDFWSSRAKRGVLGNVWGFTWRAGATATVGLGDAGFRLGRGAIKLVNNMKNGINSVIDAVKEEL